MKGLKDFQERLFQVLCEGEQYGYAVVALEPIDLQGADISGAIDTMIQAGEKYVEFNSPYEEDRDHQCWKCNSLMRESGSRLYMICDVCGETS